MTYHQSYLQRELLATTITSLAMDDYGGGYKTKPSALLNSVFMSTARTAARMLVAVASNVKAEPAEKWKVSDHLRFMLMLLTWLTLWILRILMDHLPVPIAPSPPYSLDAFPTVGSSFDFLASSSAPSVDVVSPASSSSSSSSFCVPSLRSTSSVSSSLELVSSERGMNRPSDVNALRRALSHIFAVLNEIPAKSTKYQFAMGMVDKIMDENARAGQVELLQINRAALASAFARTSNLLYCSLQSGEAADGGGAWSTRIIRAIPLGSSLASYFKTVGLCLSAILPLEGLSAAKSRLQRGQQAAAGGGKVGDEDCVDVVAEKHAQELLWITSKLKGYGAMDEALVQWSFATGLASLSIAANPRVQGFMVKITAILFKELIQGGAFEVSRQVKLRMLVLWLPLFCYAGNGVAYPILLGREKAEMERVLDEVISSLPITDQEIILTHWLHEFATSTSDWPNLQASYDRWCQFSRKLVI
ncbi:uncharacterized protein LOC131154554 [Malania oleifera]|uniref:uncharacterized protein LOC131154554 n=1 Tax=Malania oleifera TaxID=397392 RepID=UPI0025AE8A7E|nr:uncharacterized protein LOC131154554 [Malania oleifera]